MRSALFKIHRELKATFTEFAGWKVPLHFGSPLEEAVSVRKVCGIFDVSHMGRLIVEGNKAKDILQWLTTNNVEALKPGYVQYNLFVNERGGIRDDVTVYLIEEGVYMLCVNAINRNKIRELLLNYVKVRDITEDTVQIAVQGPESEGILNKFFDISEIRYYRFRTFGNIIVSRTGYTGEKGYEIYAPVEEGKELFSELLKYCTVCGLASRDILRIEAGFPLYGNEIDEDITPLEASLERFIFKDKEFLGKEDMFNRSITKKLFKFMVKGKGIPRKDYKIWNKNGEAGYVTSGTFSPTYGKGVGMAFIHADKFKDGSFYIDIRGRKLEIEIIDNLLKLLKSYKTN